MLMPQEYVKIYLGKKQGANAKALFPILTVLLLNSLELYL